MSTMRQYHKTGNKPGKPAYRTQASFRGRAHLIAARAKVERRAFVRQSRTK